MRETIVCPKVLMIKHLPVELPLSYKVQLLKHFGAERVWQIRTKRSYVFASFSSGEKSYMALHRLHQLEFAKRRLVVEFSSEEEPLSLTSENDNTSQATENIKEFLHALNAFNPSVDFYQPAPIHLNFTYPTITPQIVINIIRALFMHKTFYCQTLHLMNKMSLEHPIKDNELALSFFKDTFREYFIDEIARVPPEDSESEISSGNEEQTKHPLPTFVNRRISRLAKTRKRPAAIITTATLPKSKKPRETIDQREVFDVVAQIGAKKISVKVSQDALQKQPEESEVVGEIGKFKKEEKPVEESPKETKEPEQPTVSKEELFRNRITHNDMRVLPVFKNYTPGEPSMRLYIKNLAKTVTEQDLKGIYKQYVKDTLEGEQIGFDVRVMQEGRMKGQAFVTFPSVALAEKALNETNGYMLKDKPIVVQFARAAASNPVE